MDKLKKAAYEDEIKRMNMNSHDVTEEPIAMIKQYPVKQFDNVPV